MSAVIETKKLTKSYGRARGIIDVDLTVNEGEIVGFIGPNGAGKSTTIRTLLSLIYKTGGEARIFGLDCHADRVKILQDVGYLPAEVFYYENMRAIDLLKYSAGFYKKDCTARMKELSDALELDLTRKIEDMSLGNKKKVGIVQGLMHSPKLIILDEPTSGLDPLMQRTFFNLVKAENERGAAVLFSSHILSEVQNLCSRVVIIKDGRIISTQKISELHENACKRVRFSAAEPITAFAVEGATDITIDGGMVSLLFRGDCNRLLAELSKRRLTNIDITEPSLEEIFLHYYN